MTCYQICNKTGAISRAGTLTSAFYCGVRVAYFVVSFVMFCISYFVFVVLFLFAILLSGPSIYGIFGIFILFICQLFNGKAKGYIGTQYRSCVFSLTL